MNKDNNHVYSILIRNLWLTYAGKTFLLFVFSIFYTSGLAQKYKSQSGSITFFSSATIEDITATTVKSGSVIDLSKRQIVFSVPINTFEFDKSLMKEHFNEKYMESEKFPKAVYSGTFSGFDPSIKGKQNASSNGSLTIHGVKKQVKLSGTLEMNDDTMWLESTFIVKLEDYEVKIPKVLWQNIAEQVEVTVKFQYVKYE